MDTNLVIEHKIDLNFTREKKLYQFEECLDKKSLPLKEKIEEKIKNSKDMMCKTEDMLEFKKKSNSVSFSVEIQKDKIKSRKRLKNKPIILPI